ncbi:hypothetical protein EV421DRAFT_1743088 [Armillaria borealis]|uniref:Uncharacterized protein n=1 Tax=Armillaria borealis TaxID=47425 RepID=A0AA39IXE7_9AGAR|nr:hypothetical protein EV421DRAFT_1743088 [Armillaria borealis]
MLSAATSVDQGCTSSEKKEAHVDLFTHRLRKGINVDNAALLTSEEDQTRRRLYAIAHDDPVIADTHVGLVDVFDKENQGLFRSTPSNVPLQCTMFTDKAGGQSILEGEPVMVSSFQQFGDSWKSFTENMLLEIDWNNITVAGGSVLACLDRLSPTILGSPVHTRQYYRKWYPNSDIDLFLYGLSPEDVERKIKHIYDAVKSSLPYDVICVRTKNTVSVHSQYPFRVIQIVLRLYSSVIKYASRGIGILIPTLWWENVNPDIYRKRPSELQGLVRLLCMENLISMQTQNLHRPDMEKVFKVHGLVVDDTMESCMPNEVSDYAHFHVPHGPEWNAARIKCHIVNADHLLNSEDVNLDPIWKLLGVRDEALMGEAWHLHHHPAFCGSAQDCLEGCQSCSQLQTPQEALILADWSKKYVHRHVKFFKENPGCQMMSGSFNPITIGDWSTEAYSWDQGTEVSSHPLEDQERLSHHRLHRGFRKTVGLLMKSLQYSRQAMEAVEALLRSDT